MYESSYIKAALLGNASGDIDLCLGEGTPSSKSGRGKRKPKE
jgi:hypothetical protein